MTRIKIAYALSAALVLFVLYFGSGYVFFPQTQTGGFGLPVMPSEGDPILAVKGVRDIGTALVVLALLLFRNVRALGWAMLALAFIPFGDMLIVLTHNGSVAAALGIHGATCAVMLLISALFLIRPAQSGQ
ncbi:DUF4267 domain-containing protein [Amycolatopsis regifaucium]|uniref:Small membrane hydrophobic protein n=1 Tax=Amycolatopsis regifaucium TaxID=546365 RepID=A0A154M5P7_9PSEU|nr:DUF4267 domain-containing protein [Amycolatopsis regifaucium]KZB79876.1 small membrane hydrophobic protein [Amycolatopsis regifaucium]OKA09806.1 small membrane hydrophobic protein [Amycolatopsis regifaucium]SFJ35039.1 protein of unknown function [Amycolatopsis regifaucium]